MTEHAPQRRPLIGLSSSELREVRRARPTPQGDPAMPELALGLTYPAAVQAAGGIAVILPPVRDPDVGTLLDRLDALCLTGGADVDPSTFGAEPHPELGPVAPSIDRFERALLRAADHRDMPVLGVCRGLQSINVARGGSLHQHLPDLGGAVVHRAEHGLDGARHPIEVRDGSALAAIVGAGGLEVNSYHHQAVDRLGTGLEVVASAADGIVEGVEDPARGFLVAVQWHAETLIATPAHRRLFEALVAAALRAA